MAIKVQTRNVGPLSMRGALRSVNTEKRTVEVVWTTGAKVLRNSWFDGPSYEELSLDPKHVRMGRLNNGAPFLKNHDGYDVARTLGVVESARLEGSQGVAVVRFSKAEDDPEADKVFRKIADGIIQNVSVGYRTYKSEKVESGDEKIPTFRAIDWEPYEISAVAMGADDQAKFRSESNQMLNPCVFETRQEPNVDEEQKKAEAEKLAEQKRQTELKAAEDKAAEKAKLAERERVSGISHAVRSLGAAGVALAATMITSGVSLDKARETVLEELAKRSDADPIQTHLPQTERGEDDADKWRRGAIAGILSRTGQMQVIAVALAAQNAKKGKARNPDIDKGFKGFDATEDGGEFRGLSLLDLARWSLERRGVQNVRGMSVDKVIERSLYARDNGGQQTSSDFSVVLENVMYKTLLGEYAQQSDTWRRFCGVDSVQDFRPSNRFRLGSFGVLDTIDESGEYKQKQIPDGIKQTITTQTYGNKIALSRKAIINDDMGAVMASAGRFGRMAGLSIEVAVYALLAQNAGLGPTITYNGSTAALCDNTAFGNVSTGAALSMVALEADRVKMAQQKDISNNEFLDLRPNTLLIPLGLEGEANVLNRAKFDPTASSAFERPNIVGGLFRDVVGTPRLTGTKRYLFSDQTPALLVAFLNGVQTPMMDQRPGWDIDGIEWKLRLDFLAQGFDPKGIIYNAGV